MGRPGGGQWRLGMVGMRLYTVRVRIVTVDTGVGAGRGGRGGRCEEASNNWQLRHWVSRW